MERVKRILLIAILLIASVFSLMTLNKAVRQKKQKEIEKNKLGKVIQVDEQYKLIYYSNNINVSTKKFPEATKKTFNCESKECGIIKTGGIYAVIYDTYNYYIYNTKKEKILYKTNMMRDVSFSSIYKNNQIKNDSFIVYKDINNRSCLYNLRKNKITINGEYKEIYSNYTVEYQPNVYYVVAKNQDNSHSIINFNSGQTTLTYNKMYCANDSYCVIDNKYVYDFSNEKYVVKPGTYNHIYMAIKNAIAVNNGTYIYVVDDNGTKLGDILNLGDYKNYLIKTYFENGKDNIVYMIFDLSNEENNIKIKFNLKTLKIEN